MLVVLVRLGLGVVAVGIAPEAPGIDAGHVDLGIAVHHPLGQILAAAGALRHADRRAVGVPEIFYAAGRADQGVVVRGVGDRTADHPLDAGLAPDRHALEHLLHVVADALEVGLEELVLGVPLGPAAAVLPALLGLAGLVDADQAGLLLLAVIGRGIGVAHDRHLLVALEELLDRLGHQVGVLHVGHRQVGADHLGDLAGIAAGGVDHVLARHPALLGLDLPLAVGPGDVEHPVAAHDRGAHVARALGQGVAAAGRIDVAVVERPGAGDHAFDVDEGVDALDLVGADRSPCGSRSAWPCPRRA